MRNSSRRFFLHCANSYSSHLHVGVQTGPNGAKTQHSFPAHAAVQGCTPAHCYTLGNTDTELIPVARQCRSIAVASAALAICHAQDWLCFFDCRRREMLVQQLVQGHGGDRSSESHGPLSQSALFGSKSLLLALARGCVLCLKQGKVSEPEQRLIPLCQFPRATPVLEDRQGSRSAGPGLVQVRQLGKSWL